MNQRAWPAQVDEGFVFQHVVADRGAEGTGKFGYHFAAVVARSDDGHTVITLENSRSDQNKGIVTKAFEKNLDYYLEHRDELTNWLKAAEGGNKEPARVKLAKHLDALTGWSWPG